MSEKPASRPYSVRNQIRWLLNNELFSDVAFLIDGKKVFAHKNIVSLGSEAFAGMFYGPIKEKQSEIDILGVEYDGFLNVMRYLYGFKISEIAENLAHLGSTYMVADRYLVEHLKEELIKHIKYVLDPSNCLMIYDQLFTLPAEETALQQVRRFVQSQTKLAFDHLPNISQMTLLNLLGLEFLALPEIEVLKACANWVEAEASKQELTPNSKAKKTICNSFKHLILFAQLSIKDLTKFQNLNHFLSIKEVGNLFLHLANKTNYPLRIECKTPRRTLKKLSVSAYRNELPTGSKFSGLTTLVNVNRKIFLSKIRTSLSSDIEKLKFSVVSDDEKLRSGDDRAHSMATIEELYWTITFREIYELDPKKTYTFAFKFTRSHLNGDLSSQLKLELGSGEKLVSFTLNSEKKVHCIQEIVFHTLV